MNGEKIILLLQSEEFLAKLNDSETVAETKKLFASEGLGINDEKAQIIMDALKSANKKAHDGEIMSEEDLKLISGGGVITKALEFVILSSILATGVGIGVSVHKRGGIKNKTVLKYIDKAKDAKKHVEDRVVNWLTTP